MEENLEPNNDILERINTLFGILYRRDGRTFFLNEGQGIETSVEDFFEHLKIRKSNRQAIVDEDSLRGWLEAYQNQDELKRELYSYASKLEKRGKWLAKIHELFGKKFENQVVAEKLFTSPSQVSKLFKVKASEEAYEKQIALINSLQAKEKSEKKLKKVSTINAVFIALIVGVLLLFCYQQNKWGKDQARIKSEFETEMVRMKDWADNYQLWSALDRQENVRDTSLQMKFDSFFKNLQLLKPEPPTTENNSPITNIFGALVNPANSVAKGPPYFSNMTTAPNSPFVDFDDYRFFLDNGVYTVSPDSLARDSSIFARIDNMIVTTNKERKISKKSLGEHLSQLIGFKDDPWLEPILLYALVLDTGNLDQAQMYRYPRYLNEKDESKDKFAPYRDYWHVKRDFFIEWRQRRASENPRYFTKSLTDDSTKIYLSSVYSDFKKLKVTPIRTLMYERTIGNKIYLLCIDFKFKELD